MLFNIKNIIDNKTKLVERRAAKMKLSESELKIMEIIWDEKNLDENREITAKKVSNILTEKYGWNKSANYVYFKRLLEKGAIDRRYPNYTIRVLVQKENLINESVGKIIDKNFGGSVLNFFSAFISDRKVTPEDIKGMREIIDSFNVNKDMEEDNS